MIKKLSYQYVLALLGLILVLLLVGTFHLKSLLTEKIDSHSLLRTQTQLIANSSEILLQQAQELKRLSSASKTFDKGAAHLNLNNSIDFGVYLEKTADKYGIRMISLPREQEETVAGFKTLQAQFSVEGTHAHLLSFLYELEQRSRIGSISHLNFLKEDLRIHGKKKKVLTLQVTLKRLIEI